MHDPLHDPTVAEIILEEIPALRLRFKTVEWNAKTFDSLVLREPTVQDLLEARKLDDSFDQALCLIQRVSGTPMQVLLKLPKRVLEKAADYFAPFTPPSPGSVGAA